MTRLTRHSVAIVAVPLARTLPLAALCALAAAGASSCRAAQPAAAVAAVAAAPAVNQNAGFEGAYADVKANPGDKAKLSGRIAPGWFDNSGWADLDLAYAEEKENPHSGSSCLKATLGAVRGFGQMQLAQVVQAEQGKEYTVAVWLRASRDGVPVSFGLRPADGGEMYKAGTATAGKGWQRFAVTANVAKGGGQFLLVTCKEPNVSLYIDDVEVTQGADTAAAPAAAAAPVATPAASGGKAAPAGPTWAFDPPKDAFSPDALLDLRSLNEKVAGEHGFITATPDGGFARGDGQSIRFWAVTEYSQRSSDPAALAHKARWLAKRGVNMVRAHSQIQSDKDGAPIDATNDKEIDQIWRLVAAMKKEGIYTTISPYWANVGTKATGANSHGQLFFNPKLQAAYKEWMKALYAKPNPYTGIPLAKDPAVAIIQLQNEDSMLFWTIGAVKGDTLTMLRGAYGAWLKKKYGSLEAANKAWGGDAPGPDAFQEKQGDEFAAGRAGVYIPWFLTADGRKQVKPGTYQAKRLADQLEYYTQSMADFNREMARFFREELGAKQLINAGNWRPADPTLLFDAERISYLPNEVMGVNRYFDSVHEGKDNGWAVRAGDTFTNNSATLDPRGLPINVKQPAGRPFIVPETEWVYPNGFQSEGPLLTAAYQSLTGVDASYFFAAGETAEWAQPQGPKVGDWQPPVGKWSVNIPMQVGMFPAAALLFRQGYVKQAAPVVHEERTLADVYSGGAPIIAEEAGYDPNRDIGPLAERSAVKTRVSPLAFLAGPVEVVYGGDPAKSTVDPKLSTLIDESKKTVVSATGELRLNYGKGVCVVNAPKAQAAAGFLGGTGGPIALSDVTITSRDEYATVAVVSMDGQPVKGSKKLLVQVGTVARPNNWQDKQVAPGEDPTKVKYQVVEPGGNPWQIRKSSVTVTVKNPALKKATVLDANGMPVKTLPLAAANGAVTVTFPSDALYVVLQ
jgi:hypothetical protein